MKDLFSNFQEVAIRKCFLELSPYLPEFFLLPRCELVCAWGDRGAMGISRDGKVVQSIAYQPPEVIDTLAAGDTFVAAAIYQLASGRSLQESITFGCKLAGAKIGVEGLKNLRAIFEKQS